MLSSFKGKAPEKDQGPAGSGPPSFLATGAQPQRSGAEQPARPEPMQRPELMTKPATKPESMSSIGSGMSIVGQIVCTGQARVFGRVEGELRVSDLLIGEGAQIEGNVIAQEVTVRGHVKGTIRAVRVRLEDGATVEGDIVHRSLSIEEGAVFEGSSRRVDNPTDAPAGIPEEIPQERSPRVHSVVQPQAATSGADFPAQPSAEPAQS
jgi:cytoskeletal protein CcmA (bactofilin family)